jgi:hypothetical protein
MYNNIIRLPSAVNIPVPLYKSEQGKYFVGYADDLDFSGEGVSAWAMLYNPPDSKVNLHVNVWTVTSLFGAFRAEIWFNAIMPGEASASDLVTTSNYTLHPLPTPRVLLLYASSVTEEPREGVKAFVRRGEAYSTMVSEEDGKFIFPPGGSFSVFLSHPEDPGEDAEGRVAFGWWEEPVIRY